MYDINAYCAELNPGLMDSWSVYGCFSGRNAGNSPEPYLTERNNLKLTGIRTLLDRGRRWSREPRNYPGLPSPRVAGVYVGVENLKNVEYARFVIGAIIRNWPDSLPPISRLCIYVPADRTGLWRAWVTGGFPHMETLVRGTQHYARKSKNSADMAIVADAIADFATGAVHHVSVVSNDSDFGVLFEKLRELASLTGETGQPPFLWILPEGSMLSREIADFFPGELLWSPEQRVRQVREPVGNGNSGLPTNGEIVRWLLNEIPVGKFRAEDVLNIVRQRCPDHPAVRNLPVWGAFFSRHLLPLLGDKVRIVRQKSPRTYERNV